MSSTLPIPATSEPSTAADVASSKQERTLSDFCNASQTLWEDREKACERIRFRRKMGIQVRALEGYRRTPPSTVRLAGGWKTCKEVTSNAESALNLICHPAVRPFGDNRVLFGEIVPKHTVITPSQRTRRKCSMVRTSRDSKMPTCSGWPTRNCGEAKMERCTSTATFSSYGSTCRLALGTISVRLCLISSGFVL